MCYILADGDIFLGMSKNAYVPIPNKDNAKKFPSEANAKAILKSCVPKILRTNYTWEVIEIDEEFGVDPKNYQYNPVDIEDLQMTINELSSKLAAIQGNKDWLINEQSNVDKQISDVLHYIELNSFSACEGYKLCKVLKKLHLKRRAIKNELELIGIINCHTCNNIAKGNTNKAISGLETKQYAPRVLTELFTQKNIDKILSQD